MSDISEAETTTHDLLNQATEWLQYARGLTELLAELVHESDAVDCNRMAMGLEAISALTEIEPADSPAMVTRFGSPPKAAMFFFTHCRPAIKSSTP